MRRDATPAPHRACLIYANLSLLFYIPFLCFPPQTFVLTVERVGQLESRSATSHLVFLSLLRPPERPAPVSRGPLRRPAGSRGLLFLGQGGEKVAVMQIRSDTEAFPVFYGRTAKSAVHRYGVKNRT